jgi:hypothetical protein
MKLGAENKRAVIWLSVLGVGLLVAIYTSFFADSSASSTPAPSHGATPARPDLGSSDEPSAPRSPSRGRVEEFLPVLHKKRSDKTSEPPPADPTLRLDLLAKLNEVPPAGGGRDLFNFGKAEPVKLAGTEPVVHVAPWIPIGPRYVPPPPPHVAPPPPPPPPIALKYYGICTTRIDGQKTAFFMDGEEILIAVEGMTFKGRYRLLRIGQTSAVVEDMQYKHEQTLPLAEDAQPGSGE